MRTPTPPSQAKPAPGTVTFRGVHKSFPTAEGEHLVLRDLDFTLNAGEIVAVIGASGSGKSTLLRLIGGLGEGPSGGSVTIDDVPVTAYEDRCGVAFQEARLMPWRSVADNVRLGLRKGTDRAAGRARVARLLELVQLERFADHRPREISGGMAQRASLARALARDPQVLLLDEPFGALDALTRLNMHDLLLNVHQASPSTIVFVTHDVDEALKLADTILVVGKEYRDGAVEPGATLIDVVRPEASRPRSLASDEFTTLRHRLLERLGVTVESEA